MNGLLLAAAFVAAGGGVRGMLPSATAGAGADLGDWTVEGRYDTVGGLAHDVGVITRLRLTERFDVGLDAFHGFFGAEDIGGIRQAPSPLGNGLTTALTSRYHVTTRRGVRVAPGAGLTMRWTRLEESFGTVDRRFDPTLHHVQASIDVRWKGGAFLRFRALVPVQADFRVFGYVPLLEMGRTWSL